MPETAALLLRDKDVAKLTNLSIATIYRATEPRGRLRAIRIARTVRYTPRDVQDWIDEMRATRGKTD